MIDRIYYLNTWFNIQLLKWRIINKLDNQETAKLKWTPAIVDLIGSKELIIVADMLSSRDRGLADPIDQGSLCNRGDSNIGGDSKTRGEDSLLIGIYVVVLLVLFNHKRQKPLQLMNKELLNLINQLLDDLAWDADDLILMTSRQMFNHREGRSRGAAWIWGRIPADGNDHNSLNCSQKKSKRLDIRDTHSLTKTKSLKNISKTLVQRRLMIYLHLCGFETTKND